MLEVGPSRFFPGTSAVSILSLPIGLCAGCCAAVLCLQPRSVGAAESNPATASTEIIKADGAEAAVIEDTTAPPVEPTYGNPIATRIRVGARVEAQGGEVRDIFIMVATPLECPEQEVHVVEEDISPTVGSVDYRTLPDVKLADPGARQMLITVPQLPARQTASAVVTYEVLTKHVYAPKQTDGLFIPKKPPRELKPYLSGSPFINVGDRKIKDAIDDALAARVTRNQAGEPATTAGDDATSPGDVAADGAESEESKTAPAGKRENAKPQTEEKDEAKPDPAVIAAEIEKLTDWQRVEALYDFVRAKVKYLEGAEDMSSVQALKAEQADCHGLSALFVAMCRTMKTPARMVWVDGHQYAEFYLEDESGKGYWYPAQLAGTRAFGEMPVPMVIFQKGDNFRVPERRRERLRYATDHTTLSAAPQHKPRVVYIREQL